MSVNGNAGLVEQLGALMVSGRIRKLRLYNISLCVIIPRSIEYNLQGGVKVSTGGIGTIVLEPASRKAGTSEILVPTV